MAYINLAGGLKINTADAVDSRLVLTKAEMKSLHYANDESRPTTLRGKIFQLPNNYLCICSEDSKIYIYNASREEDESTGRFRKVESDPTIQLTYNDLKVLRDNSQLIPGQTYRIIDYVTTTKQTNTRSALHPFDIIVTALTKNTLDENARVVRHEPTKYQITFEDGITKECYIYKIPFDRYGNMNVVDCETLLGISDVGPSEITIDEENHTATTNAYTSEDLVEENLQYEYFQFNKLEAWEIKYCLDNDNKRFAWALTEQAIVNTDGGGNLSYCESEVYTRQPSFDNRNPDATSEYQFAWGTEAGVEDGDPTNFLYSKTEVLQDNDTVHDTSFNIFVKATVTTGKGVIYCMKDEYNNEAPYDFKNIQFKRFHDLGSKFYKLVASTGFFDDSAFIENIFSYNSITNVNGDYIWCYTFNSNGTIDVFNQESSRDITLSNKVMHDAGYNEQPIRNNVIKSYYISQIVDDSKGYKLQCLNNIVFSAWYETDTAITIYSNKFDENCHDNTFIGKDVRMNKFGNNCDSNTLGNSCRCNKFGNDCRSNIFNIVCYNNTFSDGCENNTFGYGSSYNKFGNDCRSNTFGDDCNWNKFGNNCDSNTLGNSCIINTFGDDCNWNKFGNNCLYITFGAGCTHNTFGTYNVATIDGVQHVIVDSGCEYLNITHSAAGPLPLQNIRICLGVKGGDPGYKTITCDRGLKYETTIKTANAQTILV